MGEGRGREVLVCNPRLLEEGFTCITAKIKGLGTIAPVPFQYRRPCTEVGKCDDLHFFPCHLELESTMISKSILKLHSEKLKPLWLVFFQSTFSEFFFSYLPQRFYKAFYTPKFEVG